MIEGKITERQTSGNPHGVVVMRQIALEILKTMWKTVGYDCGIMLEKFHDFKEGDIIEAYVMEEIKD